MKIKLLIAGLVLALYAHSQTLPNAVPMPTPEIQYMNSRGQPLAGAFLCTFAAGTSTPLATYTDSTASTPNTNPIVLDVNGRASVWIGPQLYKFVLYVGGTQACPSTGAVQWSQDNVTDTTLYFTNFVKTAGTATLITYLDPLTGAVSRTVSSRLSDFISVKDFGAKGDGVTDDTAAIQAGLNGLPAAGATLYFPAGRYLVTSSLSVNCYTRLLGDGYTWNQGAFSPGQSEVFSTNNINVLTFNTCTGAFGTASESITIEKLAIRASGAGTSRGIYAPVAVDGWVLRDIAVTNAGNECIKMGSTGITVFGGTATYIDHIFANSCLLTARSTATAYIGAVDVSVFDLWVSTSEFQATVTGAGSFGTGFAAAFVSRATGNGWYWNNVCELSEVGCVFLGVGPAYISGNRADLNQGYGFVFVGASGTSSFLNELNVVGNWAYKDSQAADNSYPGFLILSGNGSFIGNRCSQQSTDDGTSGNFRMSDCFNDSGSGESTEPRLGNIYVGNNSDGIAGQTYNFSGSMAKQVYSDPFYYLTAGAGGVPYVDAVGQLTPAGNSLFARKLSSFDTRLLVGSDPVVITAATQANPMVLTLASSAPATWSVGATIAISGATYQSGFNSLAGLGQSTCWTMNTVQTISAISGSSVTIALDGTNCHYQASSAVAFLSPLSAITIDRPAAGGISAELRTSGPLANWMLQDKRAFAFGSNNSKWHIGTNYDAVSGAFSQLLIESVPDNETSTYGRFAAFNRNPTALTPINIGLMGAGGYVSVGSDNGDNNANAGKLQVFGTIQSEGVNFASLPPYGTQFTWCNDCTVATPCAGGGSGAWAFRTTASVWKCPF